MAAVKASTRQLTDRQIEILQMAAEGLTAKEIGPKVGVSHVTVHTVLATIHLKLGVTNTCHAIATGFRNGFLK